MTIGVVIEFTDRNSLRAREKHKKRVESFVKENWSDLIHELTHNLSTYREVFRLLNQIRSGKFYGHSSVEADCSALVSNLLTNGGDYKIFSTLHMLCFASKLHQELIAGDLKPPK